MKSSLCLYAVLLSMAFVGKIHALDEITDVVGTPNSTGFSGDGGQATLAKLNVPALTTHDSAGNLYFTDLLNQRVRRVDATTKIITTIAGNGTAGFSGDNGPATSAQLHNPVGVVCDNANNIYVSDQQNNRIRKIDTTGKITTIAGNGSSSSGADGVAISIGLATPGALAYDPSGNGGIVFGELNGFKLRRVDLGTGMALTIAGTGVEGAGASGVSATSSAIGEVNGKYDASGNFYMIDAKNEIIRKISGGIITTIAGTGSTGFSGDNAVASSATFAFASGSSTNGALDVDAAGNIYVSDTFNNRIRKIAAGTNIITTICGTGTAGYNGTFKDATTAQINGPLGVEFNGGKLFVVDAGNQVIRALTFNTTIPSPPVVSGITVSDDTNTAIVIGLAGVQYTVSVTASDPASLPLSFIWDFGDGTSGSGNPISHTYATGGTYTVSLTVSNGGAAVSASGSLLIVDPNSGGQGVTNIEPVGSETIDPFSLLGLSVKFSNGGVLGLNVDADNVVGSVLCTTEFDGIGTRSAKVPGLAPINKFFTHGVFVALCNANDTTTAKLMGKCRLTLPIGAAEVGETQSITAKPRSNAISKVKLKGKFNFSAADSLAPLAGSSADQVSLSGSIELPAGFDLNSSHEVDLAIGNIMDMVTVDTKGKGSGGTVAKKVQIKFPKVPKGSGATTAGQFASISITLAGSSFSANGFDTEGITNQVTTAEKALKSINRKIQVALVVDGTPYLLQAAPVTFKLSKTGTTGQIGTRRGP
jgi:PKD repeat protein